jgi:hypothetical protein
MRSRGVHRQGDPRRGGCSEKALTRQASRAQRGGEELAVGRARLAALGSLILAAPAVAGQTPRITHDGVGCVVAGRYPRFEARIEPAAAVGRARVLFRAEGSSAWYFVEMRAVAGSWTGVLPRPTTAIHRFSYYLEAIGTSFEEGRTAEHSPRVVGSPVECEAREIVAAASAAGPAFVGAPAGAPPIPPGFAAAPVPAGSIAGAASSGTGGGTATGLVLGLAGAVVVGGTVAAVARGSEPGASSASPGTAGASGTTAAGVATTPRAPQSLNLGLSNGCQLEHGTAIYAGDDVTIIRGTCQWTTLSEAQSDLAQSTATIAVDSAPIGPVRYRGPYLEGGYVCAAAEASWTAVAGHHVASGTWTLPGSPWHTCAVDVLP